MVQGSESIKRSSIDRFLVSWIGRSRFLIYLVFGQTISDHVALLLEGIWSGKTLFHFENMLLEAEGFVELVQVVERSIYGGTPNFVLAYKLKRPNGSKKI